MVLTQDDASLKISGYPKIAQRARQFVCSPTQQHETIFVGPLFSVTSIITTIARLVIYTPSHHKHTTCTRAIYDLLLCGLPNTMRWYRKNLSEIPIKKKKQKKLRISYESALHSCCEWDAFKNLPNCQVFEKKVCLKNIEPIEFKMSPLNATALLVCLQCIVCVSKVVQWLIGNTKLFSRQWTIKYIVKM